MNTVRSFTANQTRYELPPEGITLLGYIVRRMHKTKLLTEVPPLLAQNNFAAALHQVGLYAAQASASFGPAYYQPTFNRTGETVSENDPQTGASVFAKLASRAPHYVISYQAQLPSGELFSGTEEITGTTIGWRGLGMPAPSRFKFVSGAYQAEMVGVITSELAPNIFQWKIRAYGSLDLRDNQGNSARLKLNRQGVVELN